MFNDDRIFELSRKGGMSHVFKTWHKLTFYGDQKNSIATSAMRKVIEFFSVAIRHAPTIE
jgi:hypothetical protein